MKKGVWLTVIFGAAGLLLPFLIAEAAVVSNTLTGTCDPQGLTVTLSWQPYGGATTNGLQRGSVPLTPGATCTGTADYWCFLPNEQSQYTYTDTDLSPNVKYGYRVKVTGVDSTNTFFCDTGMTSPAPQATTYAATGVTQTTATLNGGVNPNGRVTTYWFEWSTGGGQAQTVGSASLGAGTDIVPVFFPLAGLQSNTLYSYRVVAQSSQGTTQGALVSFTTTGGGGGSPPPPPPPLGGAPIVITNPATDITATTATLNGSVNPNGSNTKVWFDYGRTDSLGKSSVSTAIGSGTGPTDITVSFSDADPDTLYYYRIVASNPSGWSYGAILSFRTAAKGGGGTGGGSGGGAAPTTRTTVATNVSKTAATLNGVVNPNGASTRAWFEYGTTKQLGQVSETSVLGSGTFPVGVSVSVFDLQTDTTYYYRLVARNAFGTTRGAILSTVSVGSPSFIMNPTSRTVNAGLTADFTASYDPDGAGPKPAVNVTASSTWNSSNPAVASHQGNGRFRGQSAGRAIVTAFYNSKSATFRIDDLQNLTSQAILTVNQAGSALTVQTDAATDVRSNSATLHGSVNTNNSETDAWFEYGPSEFLGQVAGNQHLPGRSAPTEMSVPLIGLQPGTTYYYRLAAQNALGTLYGSTMIFTTFPAGSWRWVTVLVTMLFFIAVIAGVAFAAVKIVRYRRDEEREPIGK